jgi:hypothetical protein
MSRTRDALSQSSSACWSTLFRVPANALVVARFRSASVLSLGDYR